MSETPLLLRLHLLVVLAFLLFYAFKAGLLLLGRLDTLRAVRARTRLADSGLGLLMLGTGAAALATYPGAAPGWLWLKLGLLVVLLPLAIAALRRHHKPGVVLTLLGLVYVYGVAETGSPTLTRPQQATAAAQPLGRAETTPTPEAEVPADTSRATDTSLSAADAATLAAATETAPAAALAEGKALFTRNCAVCHGPDGKLGLNGAHDLTRSNLNATGRVYMVTNGLGKMPSFKNQLTPEQIEQVVAYSLTLK